MCAPCPACARQLTRACAALTSIEAGSTLPLVFYLLGLDDLGTLSCCVVFFLSAISQAPKRLVRRLRPGRAGRALQLRKDDTSSFPSRAVACAVCYTAIVCAIPSIYSGRADVEWWMPILMLVMIVLTSYARIQLGCHYPTDCVFGIVSGTLSALLGFGFYYASRSMCAACNDHVGMCYALPYDGMAITLDALFRVNWLTLALMYLGSVLLGVLAEVRPLSLWTKSGHMLGMLLPAFTFRVVFLCAPALSNALPPPISPPHWGGYLVAIALAAAVNVLGILTRKRWGPGSLVLLFAISLGTLMLWRSGVLPGGL